MVVVVDGAVAVDLVVLVVANVVLVLIMFWLLKMLALLIMGWFYLVKMFKPIFLSNSFRVHAPCAYIFGTTEYF